MDKSTDKALEAARMGARRGRNIPIKMDGEKARWAVRKIAEEYDALERTRQHAQEQIAKAQALVADAEKRFAVDVRHLTGMLENYFRQGGGMENV